MSERALHVDPAEPGDACDVSSCGAIAYVRLGWSPDPELLPARWWGYCLKHARPHLPASHPLLSVR